jgi:hypothetical protein
VYTMLRLRVAGSMEEMAPKAPGKLGPLLPEVQLCGVKWLSWMRYRAVLEPLST